MRISRARGSACGSAPCARGDDRRKARGLGAEAAHEQLQLDRHVPLRAPHDTSFEHALQRLVGKFGSRADAIYLPGVLDRAQTLDETRAGNELPPLAKQLGQARVLLDGEARVVESQALARRATG